MTEIIIVISIFAIILAVGIPQLTRWSANSRLQASLQRMKAALHEAKSKARNLNSTVGMPSGYNPNSANTVSIGSGQVDEMRITCAGKSIIDEHIDGLSLQASSLTGPAMNQTDVTQAMQVVLVGPGTSALVEAFDSSGNAVWLGTLTFSNGYQTWNLNITSSDVQLVQAQ